MTESAVAEARQAIHDNDVARLKQLLSEHPDLLAWSDDEDHGGLLGMATSAYGDAGDPQREGWFTRAACAQVLIDAGAVVMPSVSEGLLQSRAKGLLELFHRKGLLPHTLKFLAARGEHEDVRAALANNGHNVADISEAFVCGAHFRQHDAAATLLDTACALDPELGARLIGTDRDAFTKAFETADIDAVREFGLWAVFVMEQLRGAVRDGQLSTFVAGLDREPWLLSERFVKFQTQVIEAAAFGRDRAAFITALLDRDPAILRVESKPRANAIQWAFMYANVGLLPELTRIWPVPDDLPHAAGLGNLAKVQEWFDEAGALKDIERHYPYNDPDARSHLQWTIPTAQQVLDVAFAFAVINRHFAVADFLLEQGADINTNWNSHEPASILHHLVFLPDSYDSMQYLIDRGIDMMIKDHRWKSDARGWALYGKGDEDMARWLETAQRKRDET